jgi:hypothetical protein
MSFSLNPAALVTDAITSLVNSAVIVGMPTQGAPVPLFCLCEFPEETIHGAVTLPGALTQAGEMKTRSVIQPSSIDLSLAIVEHDSKNPEIFKTVQVALTAIAVLINEIASYGTILPNLTGLTTGYVASQISSLFQIKNNMQPVMVLSSYFSLGILQQNTSYLSSSWFIEEIEAMHEGGKDGTIIKLKLKEQFTPRNASTLQGMASAIAGETISPLAGLAVGGLF